MQVRARGQQAIHARGLHAVQAVQHEVDQPARHLALERADLVDATVERFGRIDALVNNAAGNFVVHAEELAYWFAADAARARAAGGGSG